MTVTVPLSESGITDKNVVTWVNKELIPLLRQLRAAVNLGGLPSLTGNAGEFLKVNAGETAPEWDAIPGGGDMLASNNLSEVTPATARTNLGLGIGVDVQAYDPDLTTLGALGVGARAALGLAIGTDVQAWAAPLDAVLGTNTGDQTFLAPREVALSVNTAPTPDECTPNAATTDVGTLASLAAATKFINPSGTPSPSQSLLIRVETATSRAITWDTQYRAGLSLALPTATSGGGLIDYWGFRWHSVDSKWDYVGEALGY